LDYFVGIHLARFFDTYKKNAREQSNKQDRARYPKRAICQR
jgi:hypothetical protein